MTVKKILSLEAFYDQYQLDFPSETANLTGHFNVFERNRKPGPEAENIPYSQKAFFKICLLSGRNRIFYGDQIIDSQKNALLFINPRIPYGIEILENDQSGYFCLFSGNFISDSLIRGNQLRLLEKDRLPLLDLPERDFSHLSAIYARMQQELSLDFKYKNELLRSLVAELTFSALNLSNAQRAGKIWVERSIPALFTDLLEAQFPIDPDSSAPRLGGPAAFAEKLSVHLNHLNRTLRETYGKSTSRLITERTIQEARRMLRRTNFDISEIAWRLGFNDLSYFIQVFRKETRMTPKAYRDRSRG